MRAERTRPGGRHMLDERGGYGHQRCAPAEATATMSSREDTGCPPATAPLWTFLRAESLAALKQCYQFARAA